MIFSTVYEQKLDLQYLGCGVIDVGFKFSLTVSMKLFVSWFRRYIKVIKMVACYKRDKGF